MKPDTVDRSVQTSGVLAQTTFGISMADAVYLIRILRSTLYTNKPLAVLREYGSNAWDEHVQAGIPDRPIHVTLPSVNDRILRIRDFGRGLSWEQMVEVFTQYGASTKRDSDRPVGTMGIGCKSAFSYSDTFTVTSWHGGKKSVYVAVLDETDIGRMDLMHQEESDEETGIEIAVPVERADIRTFRRTARWLFYYMHPQPTINVDLERPEMRWEGEHGFWGTVQEEGGWQGAGWYALMGCVPYKIDLGQLLEDDNGSTRGGPPLDAHSAAFLRNHSGCLYFKVREVRISANREEVEYTEDALRALKDKVRAMLQEMLEQTVRDIGARSATPWERRRAAWEYERATRLRLPGGHHDLAADIVPLYPDGQPPESFHLYDVEWTRNDTYRTLSRTREFRIKAPFVLIRDLDRKLHPYVEKNPMVVACPSGVRMDVGKVEAELAKLLADAGLTGVPIKRMSEMQVVEKAPDDGPVEREVNPKHQERYFVLNTRMRNKVPHSDNWDIVDRVPTDDDVFVLINRFEAVGVDGFIKRVKNTRRLFDMLGLDMPPIYGLKTTERKPVYKEDVPGMHFTEWRRKVIIDRIESDREFRDLLDAYYWSSVFNHGWFPAHQVPETISWLKTQLDGRHRIIVFLRRFHRAHREMMKLSRSHKDVIETVARMDIQYRRAKLPKASYQRIMDRYPLLRTFSQTAGLRVFLPDTEEREDWVEYVTLIDKDKKP